MNEKEGKAGRVRERARVTVSEKIREGNCDSKLQRGKKGKGDRTAIYDDQPRLSLRLMPDMENIPAHFTLELLIMGN